VSLRPAYSAGSLGGTDAVAVLEASMLVIGDEILGGFVQDTNSGWLATQLMETGIPFTRVSTIPDTHADIDEGLLAELGRSRPRLVFTSGGIGSTPDDITFEAIAASLGQGLRLDPLLGERIESALGWAASRGLDVDETYRQHMLRMARIPEGATLMAPEVTWAPGVRIDVDGGIDADGVTIIVLPGVPSQFRTIVTAAVRPELMDGRNPPVHVEEIEHWFPESVLNACFDRLQQRWPTVKLGSYPSMPMLVRLIGPEAPCREAAAHVRAEIETLLATGPGRKLAREWKHRWASQDG